MHACVRHYSAADGFVDEGKEEKEEDEVVERTDGKEKKASRTISGNRMETTDQTRARRRK